MTTIVFVHGMFQNPKSWTRWVEYISRHGFECVVPAWPLHDGDPTEFRESPPPGLGELGLDDVVATMRGGRRSSPTASHPVALRGG